MTKRTCAANDHCDVRSTKLRREAWVLALPLRDTPAVPESGLTGALKWERCEARKPCSRQESVGCQVAVISLP